MAENSIAVIPENGYNPKQNTSKKAQQWLQHVAEDNDVIIQSTTNGGERRVGHYQVDGFCESTKTMYEFYGCYWHWCNRCFTYGTWNSTRNYTMGYLYNETAERRQKLLNLMPGYKLVEKWECAYDTECKENANLRQFITDYPVIEELKPRDALYGGRTNAFQLYYKCKDEEKIKYYDFTSLYPAVQKQELYPIGHPEIITSFVNNDISAFFGLIKCKVIPPAGLYAPVLPARINNKLVFTLCQQCADDQDMICKHNEAKRAITGTWPTIEVNKALEKGYQIVKIFEVWHLKEKGDLLSKYDNACIKEKQEASGFPEECVTDEQKRQYIQDYYHHEGIELNYDKINKNSGARQVAKMKANSQWGYLAMHTNRTRHKFVDSRSKLIQMLEE